MTKINNLRTIENCIEAIESGSINISDIPSSVWNIENAMHIAHTYPGAVTDIPDEYKTCDVYAHALGEMALLEPQMVESLARIVIRDAIEIAIKKCELEIDAGRAMR